MIKKNDTVHELVSPGKQIKTLNNHVFGIISDVYAAFPMHMWCRILPQVKYQLNLVRQSTITPKMSVYAHLYGLHNFLKKLFAPIMCPSTSSQKTDKHGS